MTTEDTAPVYREPVATTTAETYSTPATAIAAKRISWGAIFAGAVMALVAQLAFSLLGLGIGASTMNPYDNDPTAGLASNALPPKLDDMHHPRESLSEP